MTLAREDIIRPIVVAVALMMAGEAVYLIVFGVVLFPDGPFAGKLIWTFTCGIAMGSVAAALTIALVIGRMTARAALLASAAAFAAVGVYCSFLCLGIDAKFNYFGGPQHRDLFVYAGIIPSLAGGLLYGWLLFSESGRALVRRFGI